MKFAAALLIAVVFASAVMAEEDAPTRGLKENLLAKAKEIKGKVTEAIKAGKGKLEEVAKQLGLNRENAIAKLNELKAQLQAKAKEVVIPAIGKAKQVAAQKLKEQLAKAISGLQAAKEKLEKLQ